MLSVLIDIRKQEKNNFYESTASPRHANRRSVCVKNRQQGASLTLEAALAVPLFFFFFFLLWQLFLLVLVELQICRQVTDTVLDYGTLGYLERRVKGEEAGTYALGYYPLLMAKLSGTERADHLLVRCRSDAEGRVEVTVSYDFPCRAPLVPSFSLPIVQKFCFFPYLGEYDKDLFAGETAEEDVVYVTEQGEVYHERLSCTYLNLSVERIASDSLSSARNRQGAGYTPCLLCRETELPSVVYVTQNGDKYHWNLQCTALKRTVQTKPRSEVNGMRACSRCGGSAAGTTSK